MANMQAAEAAIQKVLGEYQAMAAEEKAAAPKREAAQQKIEQLVQDVAAMEAFDATQASTEMVAAFIIYQQMLQQRAMQGDPSAQMAMAQFGDDLMNSFGAHMDTVQADPAQMQAVQQAAQDLTADMTQPTLPSNETLFALAVDEPEEGFGEWTAAFIALKIDEDYNVTLADSLDFDLDVTLEISPTQSLSDEFNVPGKRYKAGQDFEPFVMSHETAEGDMSTQLQVRGYVYQDGQRAGEIQMPALPMFKQEPMGMDMEALMKMMGGQGGPGPNGPN